MRWPVRWVPVGFACGPRAVARCAARPPGARDREKYPSIQNIRSHLNINSLGHRRSRRIEAAARGRSRLAALCAVVSTVTRRGVSLVAAPLSFHLSLSLALSLSGGDGPPTHPASCCLGHLIASDHRHLELSRPSSLACATRRGGGGGPLRRRTPRPRGPRPRSRPLNCSRCSGRRAPRPGT